jgi:hypothetical protein
MSDVYAFGVVMFEIMSAEASTILICQSTHSLTSEGAVGAVVASGHESARAERRATCVSVARATRIQHVDGALLRRGVRHVSFDVGI